MTLVLNANIHKINYKMAVEKIRDWACAGESRYVCAANVHMLMEAYDSKDFLDVINQADLVTPDGMPLVWIMRWKGVRDQQRVYGPTLMLYMLDVAAKEHIPVGFYGGAPKVLGQLVERMRDRFPELNVAFSYSPPFNESSLNLDTNMAEQIRSSGVKILFVGLGCPRQEYWMEANRSQVNAVMLGVGAAFDFHGGAKPQAPGWMQKSGLEWLFRLITEPQRLWKRYLYHNPRFVFLAIIDLLRRPRYE